jgi:hypothetical protein
MINVFLIIRHLYTIIKEWVFPPPNNCLHCLPSAEATFTSDTVDDLLMVLCGTHSKLLSGVSAAILFEGVRMGTAYNISLIKSEAALETLSLAASSLVFKNQDLDRLFMNGVVDQSSQKLGFALKLLPSTEAHYEVAGLEENGTLTEVYLVDAQKPILIKYRGEEQVWINGVSLEAAEAMKPFVELPKLTAEDLKPLQYSGCSGGYGPPG